MAHKPTAVDAPRTSSADRILSLLGWVVVLWVGAVALIRLVGSDSTTWMIGLVGLTPLLMIPVYPILGMALASRRRLLTGAAVVLAVLHLMWSLPEWSSARPTPALEPGDVSVSVFSVNLFLGNPDVTDISREILASDADVVVFQELTPWQVPIMAEAGLMETYPYQLLMPRRDASGSGMMSRLPFVEAGFVDIAGSAMPVATIDNQGVLFDVVGVHVKAPVRDDGRRLWVDQLEKLGDMVSTAERPLILAGDFNATYQHDNLRDIESSGATDAMRARGKAWIATWPRDRFHPPLFRIDHIFVTSDVMVIDAGVGSGVGSDHRPIWVELALEPAAVSQ